MSKSNKPQKNNHVTNEPEEIVMLIDETLERKIQRQILHKMPMDLPEFFKSIKIFEDDNETIELDEESLKKLEEQDNRIQKILNTENIDVNRKNLITYLKYLQNNVENPCEVSSIDQFRWEEYYLYSSGSLKEYEKLKKIRPNHTDNFNILNFQNEIDKSGIIVEVQRLSDHKKFSIPLAELEANDKESNNYQILDDYSVWFYNYQ